jgi:hypothetical protein
VPGRAERFWTGLREQVRSGTFAPVPVRQKMIPVAELRRRGAGFRSLHEALESRMRTLTGPDPGNQGEGPPRSSRDEVCLVEHIRPGCSELFPWLADCGG